MFTGFGKKFEKAKAKLLNQPPPEGTATRVLREYDEYEAGREQRIKEAGEKREKKKQEKEAQKITTTIKLREELSKEISREASYLDSSINSKPHERILSKNDPEKSERTLGGISGGSSLTKLKDDGFGVFKPYENFEIIERKLQIQNERAAYLVDLFLGFDLVPPTVIRELKDPADNSEYIGSMQQFVEDATPGSELENTGKNDVDPGEIAKLAIYDFMIKNTDRHHNNYLIKDRKIYAIDHGLCFASRVAGWRDNEKDTPVAILSGEYYEMHHRAELFNPETFWNLQLPQENQDKLRAFNASEKDQIIFHQLLQELIGKRKADLFLDRITSIISGIDSSGRLNEEVFRESIYDKLNNKYSQAQEYGAAA